MMRFGSLCSSLTVNNLGGLFVTAGISFGLGSSLTYTMSKSFSCWCGRHVCSLRSIFHSTTFRSLDRTVSLDRSRYRRNFQCLHGDWALGSGFGLRQIWLD